MILGNEADPGGCLRVGTTVMGRYDEYKDRVLRMSQKLSEQGYFGTRSGSAGNVSVLVEDEDAIVVTPTRLPYDVMKRKDICVVDFDLKRIEGELKPSIEAPMHVAAYKTRPDVNAVIHTHQRAASALSLIVEPIPALFDEVALAIGNRVEIIPYALSGTRELHDMVADKVRNRCHCYIMQTTARCVSEPISSGLSLLSSCSKRSRAFISRRSRPESRSQFCPSQSPCRCWQRS
jgi:hypothetical protein